METAVVIYHTASNTTSLTASTWLQAPQRPSTMLLSPAEATQILLDHISPAALPSVKLISFTLHNQCCYRHSRFIFLGSTDPSWRWGKQTMWLLLSNTSTPSCLPAAFLSRFLFGFMTPQYALIKCYDSKQLHSACCKGHGTGVRVTMATTIDKTQTHTQTCKHTHKAPESYLTIKYCLLNANYATKWNHCTDWTAHRHIWRGVSSPYCFILRGHKAKSLGNERFISDLHVIVQT